MTETKKIIRETIGTTFTGTFTNKPMFIEKELELDGLSLDEAIDRIKEFQEEFNDRYSDIRFEVNYDFSDDRSDHRRIYLTGEREETDEEFAARIAEAVKRVEDQRTRDERDLAIIAARLGKTVV